jgi:hypothetical protein
LLTACLIVIFYNAVKVQNGKNIIHFFFSEILHQQASGANEPGINVSILLNENIMLKQTRTSEITLDAIWDYQV